MKLFLKSVVVLLLVLFISHNIHLDHEILYKNILPFQTINPSSTSFLISPLLSVHTLEYSSEKLDVQQKKIYIYNTHQKEKYLTNNVMEGARYLKQLLEKKGYCVIFEESDFDAYKREQMMDLTQSYPTSRIFLEKNIEEYGPFDLIIDFHRDALTRDNSYVTINQVNYAKMMMVIGGASVFSDTVLYNSQVLHKQVDDIVPGIMRNDFFRSTTVYNQDYTQRMLLIEVGGHENEYEEVLRSIEILAEAIDMCLKEDRFI